MFCVDELLLLLLQKTTWRCSCYSGATQRNRTEDLGRKRLSVKESECASEVPVSQGQRVVSDYIEEIAGENPQKGISLQNPGNILLRERDTASSQSSGTRLWQFQCNQTFSASQPLHLSPHCYPKRIRNWEEIENPATPPFLPKPFCMKQARAKTEERISF